MTQFALLIIGTLIARPLWAQGDLKVLTGNEAIHLFVYAGKPVHPFCLGFPLGGSSRKEPVELAKGTDGKVVPKSPREGWLEAEYPRTEGDFFISQPPYVLASTVRDKLRDGYRNCDGTARYSYDLVSEEMELSSLELSVPEATEPATSSDPQSCFDQLARRYDKNNKLRLTPEELKQSGQAFLSTCGKQ
jgi:hypothetical protein